MICEHRAIIVIGRSSEYEDDKVVALYELSSELHNISIITYDDLLTSGLRYLEIICEDAPLNDPSDEQYDLPF